MNVLWYMCAPDGAYPWTAEGSRPMDFSYFQQAIPGVFYHLGGTADGQDPGTAAPNHSPGFDVNESILPLGVKTHVWSALRFLER